MMYEFGVLAAIVLETLSTPKHPTSRMAKKLRIPTMRADDPKKRPSFKEAIKLWESVLAKE